MTKGIIDPTKGSLAAGRRLDRRLLITTEAMVPKCRKKQSSGGDPPGGGMDY